MKVGDLVKYRRNAVDAGAGVIIRAAAEIGWNGWWVILWTSGAIEVVRDQNLRVMNESR